MLIKDDDALRRLNSPLNLINKMKNASSSPRNKAMSLFIKPAAPENAPNTTFEPAKSFNPFEHSSPIEDTAIAITPEIVSDSNDESKSDTPTLDTLLENGDAQIKLAEAHDGALALLNSGITMLAAKLDDIKPEKLPAVIAAASKTVEGIRRERNEVNKNNKGRDVHYHFYTPTQKKLTDYEVTEVA